MKINEYIDIYNNSINNWNYEQIINDINVDIKGNYYKDYVILLHYIKAKCLFGLMNYEDTYNELITCIKSYYNVKSFNIYENEIFALYFDVCNHLGKYNESINILNKYEFDTSNKEVYTRLSWWIKSDNNIKDIYQNNRKYTFENYNKLKFKFRKSSEIVKNYSEMMQDIFVLSILNGKENGTYLEFGSSDYNYHNNTYLLEKLYKWTGISIDYDHDKVITFNNNRKNLAVYANALDIDYNEEFLSQVTNTNRIDYLQLDLDPNTVTLEVLKRLPLDKVRFSVITFEHDKYYTNDDVKNESRKIFEDNGYLLIGKDICCNLYLPFEDWYVDKQILNNEMIMIINKLFLNNNHNGDTNKIFYE